MAMSVGQEGGEDDVIAAINTTPLVDVMLVLLIIFLITIPTVIPEVPLDLPKQENKALKTKPENVRISVNRAGDTYLNEEYMPNSDVLFDRLKDESVKVPQPEVNIRGDLQGRYLGVGKVVLACQRAGMQKIGFIIQPPDKGG